MVPSEPQETGSESGKRSDDRGGVPKGTPHEGETSTPLVAPGSFGPAGLMTPTGSKLARSIAMRSCRIRQAVVHPHHTVPFWEARHPRGHAPCLDSQHRAA